jgi:hypothetical protein
MSRLQRLQSQSFEHDFLDSHRCDRDTFACSSADPKSFDSLRFMTDVITFKTRELRELLELREL